MAKMEQQVNINAISRIATGTRFKGEIESPTDLRIDGVFEGKIDCKGRVVVGENAVVNAEVVCENFDLFGRLSGNLTVRNVLSLMEGCNLNGDIEVNKLVVELGATFNGNCKMLQKKEASAAAQTK